MTPTWTSKQAASITAMGAWLADPSAAQVFRLFGFAGTGKTTLARHLAAQSDGLTLYAAYTGKAASVMRESGCEGATTIHRVLYTVHENDYGPVLKWEQELEQTPLGHPAREEVEAELRMARLAAKKPRFSRNPDSVLRHAKLLVLDEVSMVNEALAKDILSFGVKVLVLGDPAQLPPIEGNGFFTQGAPDVLLTEIHRQSADNPIIRMATLVREGGVIPPGRCANPEDPRQFVDKRARQHVTNVWLMEEAGQILCGKNATRQQLNRRVRDQMGHFDDLPMAGDTLVCLRNDHRLGTLNGVLCEAHSEAVPLRHGLVAMNVRYEDRVLPDLVVESAPFDQQLAHALSLPRDVMRFDFGYALTVHKAQGSQWPSVTLWDDGFGKREADLRKAWLYTAITRARINCTILTGA